MTVRVSGQPVIRTVRISIIQILTDIEFTYAMVPSLFDAIDAGKGQPSRVSGTSYVLADKKVLVFTPEGHGTSAHCVLQNKRYDRWSHRFFRQWRQCNRNIEDSGRSCSISFSIDR